VKSAEVITQLYQSYRNRWTDNLADWDYNNAAQGRRQLREYTIEGAVEYAEKSGIKFYGDRHKFREFMHAVWQWQRLFRLNSETVGIAIITRLTSKLVS